MMDINEIKILLCGFHVIAYSVATDETKRRIQMDKNRYNRNGSVFSVLATHKNFRNSFYWRIKKEHRVLAKICSCILPENKSIEIIVRGEIGGGLYFPHNAGRVITCQSMGENCAFLQGVTVGHHTKKTEIGTCPIFGSNVDVLANAVVFGGISVGNNVRIGALSVVNKDVPSNCVVAGNPFRILNQ